MEDLSLHILDIAENSIEAQAKRIDIRIEENPRLDRMILVLSDDGRGMDKKLRARALDPFVTTKTVRRIGLGLSLLAQAAKAAGGKLTLRSRPGQGTKVRATFELSHVDRKPLGNIAQTLAMLIVAHPDLDIRYSHKSGKKTYIFDTQDLRSQLGGLSLAAPQVVAVIKKTIQEGIQEIRRTL